MILTSTLAEQALQLAKEQGFALAGFTDLNISETDKDNIDEYIEQHRYGEMSWFPRHQSLRKDPGRMLSYENQPKPVRAFSALVLGMIYIDRDFEAALLQSRYRISRYAAGRDYHKVIKKRAEPIANLFQQAGIDSRICVDSAPVPEKVLARKAGLGWRGKHTLIINKDLGSFFVLGVILLSAKLTESEKDELPSFLKPEQVDLCRSCRLCIDACPTGALSEYKIDGSKCLSYITIESKSDRNKDIDRKKWVFGCDICQEVCPYNRSPKGRQVNRTEIDFTPRQIAYQMLAAPPNQDEWQLTAGMPIRRVSFEELQINYEHG